MSDIAGQFSSGREFGRGVVELVAFRRYQFYSVTVVLLGGVMTLKVFKFINAKECGT